MTSLRRLRRDLARALFGAPPLATGRPPAGRPRALLGDGLLEDRLPPGDVFWSALDALPASPAASARVPAQSAPTLRGGPAFAALPESAPALTAGRPVATAAASSGQSQPTRPAARPALELPEGVTVTSAKFVSIAPQPPKAEVTGPAAATPYAAAASPITVVQPGVSAAPESQSPTSAGVSFAPARVVGTPVGVVADPGDEKVVTPPTRTPVVPVPPSPYPYHYVADGQEVGLTISPTRVAIGFAAQPVVGQAFAGLSYVRGVTANVAVYEGTGAGSERSLARLATTRGVQFAVPVFVAPKSDSEAVLLNEVVVALKPGVTEAQFFTGNAKFSSHRPLVGTADQFVATVVAGRGVEALGVSNALAADPKLSWASPNFYQNWQRFATPNDPRFTNEWHLHNTGQSGGLVDADSDLPEAWDVNPGGSATITVAVVDDGVPTGHPDLLNWVNPGETAGDGVDNDGNGFIDDVNGWNFVAGNNKSGPNFATDMHGTSVSGVAAAVGDNKVGVAGAAYKSPVMGVKIFDGPDVASDAGIAGAIYYAAGSTKDGKGTWKSADIVNNSWGGGSVSPAINAAFAYASGFGRQGKGAANFISSGNSGTGTVSYPASLSASIAGVISVGATNNKGGRSNYSQFGTALDLVTPSGDQRAGYLNIDTTDRIGDDGYAKGDYTGTGLQGFSGTSSAAPLASGIGALVLAQAGAKGVTISAPQLRGMLRNDTDLIGGASYSLAAGQTSEFGRGRLNAFTAVSGVGKAEISVTNTTTDFASGATPVNFGNVVTGNTKSVTLRVRNQGTEPLDLAGFTATGPGFSAAAPATSRLGIGEATTFSLAFTPDVRGTVTGAIVISSNDADEASFVIPTTGTGISPQVGGRVFEDWNGDGQRSANDPGLGGRVVFADLNGNGQLDVTGGASYASVAPFTILDKNTTKGITQVSGVARPITDVNVRLNIAHTYDSDLTVTLISPDGTRVKLFQDIGGAGRNFTGTVLDDQADVTIGALGTVAPFAGSYQPQESLGAFLGKSANGAWTLEVTDGFTGDTGRVAGWSLDFTTTEPSATTTAAGVYGLFDLPPGDYPVRYAAAAGYVFTSARGGALAATVAGPATTLADYDFAVAKNNRFYGNVFADASGDGVRQAGETPLAGRTAFLDVNDNGVRDPATTATYSNPAPLAIPFGRPLGAIRLAPTVTVAAPGQVVALTVNFDISHTWDADLDLFLVAPDGTRVKLFGGVGRNEDNFTNTTLDDSAARVIGAAGTAAPFTGAYRPQNALAAFNGRRSDGVWTLEVVDTFPGLDGGSFNGFSLTITTREPSAVSDALGNFFLDLPAGPNTVRLIPQGGSAITTPAGGAYTVTAAGAPIFERLFGVK